MKFIVDSGVAFKTVVAELYSDRAIRLRDDYLAGIHELLAPDIFPGEIGHALTRAERQSRISPGEALLLWSRIMTSPPVLLASLPITYRAIEISSRTRVGVFDCIYMALSEREQCEFVTADDRLVNSVQQLFPFVRHLSSLP